MAENNFGSVVETLLKGMDSVLSTKTVVGEATKIGDTIILPLVDVSFGVGAGAFAKEKSSNAGGGLGGRIQPSAVLVIQNGSTRLVNVKNQDGITKILDMVPEFVDKFTKKHTDSVSEEVKEEAGKSMSEMLDASVNKES